MKCLKCGKDAAGTSEFCEECLADMARHPVKPDTPVILPKRENAQPVKHGRKRVLKPEQQVQSLKTTVRLLVALVIILIAALTTSVLLILDLMGTSVTSLLPDDFFITEQAIVSRETIFDK